MCDIVFLIDEKNTSVKFTVETIVSLHKSLCAPVNSNSTVTSSHLSRKQKNAFVQPRPQGFSLREKPWGRGWLL